MHPCRVIWCNLSQGWIINETHGAVWRVESVPVILIQWSASLETFGQVRIGEEEAPIRY